MSFQFIAYFSAIALSFLSGLTVYFWRGARLYLKLFPILLFITLAVEFTGYYLQSHGFHNIGVYNIFIIISTNFYFFVLFEILQSTALKKMIIGFTIIFGLFALWNILFWQKMSNFDNITFALASLFIVAGCFAYFIEIFQMPKAINLFSEPAFWICSGLIFFNICSLPYFGLIHKLENLPSSILNKIFTATSILNVFLYLIFSISFLCRLQIKKYT